VNDNLKYYLVSFKKLSQLGNIGTLERHFDDHAQININKNRKISISDFDQHSVSAATSSNFSQGFNLEA
jgi:hypothetical protein